ncbi:hypothetical protein [Celeribacter arenosi]|uniref:Membrane protein n=1 Tax=Celeribacter arenosi TaxID=792649 RepID=A0ABP7K1I4_9RHOB
MFVHRPFTAGVERTDDSTGLRLLLVALAGVVLYHGGLLPFTHGNTYDAFIHMFFGDSYHRSWFDPWEPRWYTGFATTSYPPGTHMAMGALMYVMPLRAAFVVVQVVGLLLLTVGIYRFSLLWVHARAAGYAAIGLVLASSISETIHLFGQLPTIFSLAVFLNGMPYVFRWIVLGKFLDLGGAVVFAAATTAAHHVTTIFGGVLFVFPLGLHALRVVAVRKKPAGWKRWSTVFLAPLGRGVVLAVLMLAAILITVFPYWSWSINDPITQVPIPHGSRESFIERKDLGFIFFLLPWGTALLVLPYVAWKTVSTRLWPLGASVLICFVLGTGGTTPVPRAILGGAFDILTLDRFTFWGSILILPFVGLLIDGFLHGRSGAAMRASLGLGFYRVVVAGYFVAMVAVSVFAAILPTMQPTQPRLIDPAPIVQFLENDEHDHWRYLTLGFGDQFAYISAQTTALSVDGNYHSARRLPDLTRFSVERLENAKYLGVPGLGSLKQFVVNADQYNLKYVFSNDEFYDPLLHFNGWVRLNKLSNGITVWEKPDVTPLPVITPRRDIPRVHMLMWGILPPLMLTLAAMVFFTAALRRNFGALPMDVRPVVDPAAGFRHPRLIRWVVLGALAATVGLVGFVGWDLARKRQLPLSAEETIAAYFDDLDFRRFGSAYDRLDPVARPPLDDVMFNWRWEGGLIASYGKLSDIRITEVSSSGHLADWQVDLDWLTAIDVRHETLQVRTVERDGRWFVTPLGLRPVQTPARLQRQGEVAWNVVGRRQPRAETDLHRDRLDRPRISVHGLRLVERDGRYSVIGALTNSDADPAMSSLFAELWAQDSQLARRAAGQVMAQRLLPAETAGLRVDFEGVLSLTDAEERGVFDPTDFIPPEFPNPPTTATFEARSLVTGRDLYRGVALNGLRITQEAGQPVIEGLAVNTGTHSATIVCVIALLYDDDGQPVWTEAGFVDTNIYPGQSSPFHMVLPARSEINVISDIREDGMVVNGSAPMRDTGLPTAATGTIPVDIDGYSAVRLHVSSMTYDPLF